MTDEARRTAKGWNDPPLYTFDQINKANQNATSKSSHPLHRKYKYPSGDNQIQPQMQQNVGYSQVNAYGVQQPQTSANVYPTSQQQMYPETQRTMLQQTQPAQFQQESFGYQQAWNTPQSQHPSSFNAMQQQMPLSRPSLQPQMSHFQGTPQAPRPVMPAQVQGYGQPVSPTQYSNNPVW